jgi:hypothetical protein
MITLDLETREAALLTVIFMSGLCMSAGEIFDGFRLAQKASRLAGMDAQTAMGLAAKIDGLKVICDQIAEAVRDEDLPRGES